MPEPRARRRRLKTVERHDLDLARAVALDPRGRAGRAAAAVADLGDQPPLRILCAAVIAAGLAGGHRKLARTGLRMALAHSLATMGKAFVKDSVDRTRPGAALNHVYRMGKGDSRAHDLQSMPSGHSAGVVAVAGAALADFPGTAGPVVAASTTVLAAQLPSRNHFLSDVAAGSAIGLVAAGIACWLLPPDRD